MSPMETVEHLIRRGMAEDEAIRKVQEMMEFPWGEVKQRKAKEEH